MCGNSTKYRTTYFWHKRVKRNCYNFRQMQDAGVYFVTNSVAFSMKYLELTYFRLLRGKLPSTSATQEYYICKIATT